MNFNSIWILIAIFSLFNACTTRDNQKKFKVVFSQCVQDDAWRETMLLEMKRELSFHPDIEFEFLNADGDSKTQINQLEKLLNKPFDLLIVSPNESEPLTPIVNKIFQKGKPIIIVDRKTNSELYTVYIGSDNYQIGKLAAELIVKDEILKSKPNVLYLTGLKNSSASIEREKGFVETISYLNSEVNLQALETDWRPESALHQISSVAKEDISNLAYIFCFNDRMAKSISDYINSLNLENMPKIIGVDGLALPNNGLEDIKNSTISASLLYPTGGKETIRIAKQILLKEDFQRKYDLGTVVIDTSNVDILLNLENKIQAQYQDIDKQQKLLAQLSNSNQIERYKSNILLALLLCSIIGIGLTVFILTKLKKTKKIISSNKQKIQAQYDELATLHTEINSTLKNRVDLFKNLSYSLQNPISILNSIKNELIEQSQNKSASLSTKLIHAFTNTTNRLSNIYTDIQYLENIEIGTLDKQNAVHTDIHQLISQVLYQLKILKESKNLKIKIDNKLLKKNHIIIKTWVERGLFNLFEYFFKVVPVEGNINISLYESALNTNIIVFDIQIGPFQDKSLANALEQELGLGIGVIFVQEVIKQHNGNIKLNNIDKQLQVKIEIEELKIQAEHEKLNYGIYNNEYQEQSELPAISFNTNKTILIIDEDNTWLDLVALKLQHTFQIQQASNFENAINYLKNNKVDLIITEIKIQNKLITDYLEPLQILIHQKLIPCIVFTAIEDSPYTHTVIKKISNTIIQKKYGLQMLIATVIKALEDQQRQTQMLLKLTDRDLEMVSSSSYSHKQKTFIDELNTIIGEHIHETTFNVNDLASKLNMSRISLYKKCAELLNKKPSDYILEKRIQKAKYLLKTELNISEVAYQSGFATPAHFSKVFTSQQGISPKEYKKLNSN